MDEQLIIDFSLRPRRYIQINRVTGQVGREETATPDVVVKENDELCFKQSPWKWYELVNKSEAA